VLLSLLSAAVLGAGHAITPGHGKTLMAAYLVGTRGSALHAVGLALSVSVSHTVGILVLAGVVVGASDVLAPDIVVRWAPVVAALSIVAIGGWMLLGELRRRRAVRSAAATPPDGHDHAPAHGHDEHGHDHEHTDDDRGRDEGHEHDHALEHTHGGLTHSHAPRPGSTITWRSLFALGLAGGLIPSTSALLILLGSIAAGRPAFGFVLVVAFGLGMAAVMGGIGLALVVARDRFDRLPSAGGLGRIRETVPLVAAMLVFGFGIYLTAQAIGAAPAL
jgi:nickel/cobalt exporter